MSVVARLLARGAIDLRLEALAGVTPDPTDRAAYRCTGDEPTFRLLPSDGSGLPGGWVYLTGTCERRGAELFARLEAHGDDGARVSYPVPMTRAGRIALVLELPRSVRELRFVPLEGTGKAIVRGLRLRSLGEAGRRAIMAGWAAHDLWKHRGTCACAEVGLSWSGVVTDLDAAYVASTRLRVHAPRVPEDVQGRTEAAAASEALVAARAALSAQAREDLDRRGVVVLLHATHATSEELARLEAAFARAPVPWPRRVCAVRGVLDEALSRAASSASAVVVVDARRAIPCDEAVEWLCAELLAAPETRLVTCDDVRVDAGGVRLGRVRRDAHWNPERALETGFLAPLIAVRGEAFRGALTSASPLAVAWSAMEGAPAHAHRHVPHALAHTTRACEDRSREEQREHDDLLRSLCARGQAFSWVPGVAEGTVRIDHPLPATPPTVSLIMPTRDAPGVLRTCVDSILAKTRYPSFELVIVDNGSRDPEALAFLQSLEARGAAHVLRDDAPFNYSGLNNRAVREAHGEVLAFLNNDLEVLEGSWLEVLVRHALRPGVGAVGAKLLYPDGFVQHAGVVIDAKGNPDHAYRLYPGDHPGPERRLATTQRCLAVTGACMVMRREAFERAGGFDEEHLAVAFNDVDLCFKLRALGLENVWTPHACLVHHESYSRGDDNARGATRRRAAREGRVLAERWKLPR